MCLSPKHADSSTTILQRVQRVREGAALLLDRCDGWVGVEQTAPTRKKILPTPMTGCIHGNATVAIRFNQGRRQRGASGAQPSSSTSKIVLKKFGLHAAKSCRRACFQCNFNKVSVRSKGRKHGWVIGGKRLRKNHASR